LIGAAWVDVTPLPLLLLLLLMMIMMIMACAYDIIILVNNGVYCAVI